MELFRIKHLSIEEKLGFEKGCLDVILHLNDLPEKKDINEMLVNTVLESYIELRKEYDWIDCLSLLPHVAEVMKVYKDIYLKTN